MVADIHGFAVFELLQQTIFANFPDFSNDARSHVAVRSTTELCGDAFEQFRHVP